MTCELYLHRDVKTKVDLAMPVHVFMWSMTYAQTPCAIRQGFFISLHRACRGHEHPLSGFQITIWYLFILFRDKILFSCFQMPMGHFYLEFLPYSSADSKSNLSPWLTKLLSLINSRDQARSPFSGGPGSRLWSRHLHFLSPHNHSPSFVSTFWNSHFHHPDSLSHYLRAVSYPPCFFSCLCLSSLQLILKMNS